MTELKLLKKDRRKEPRFNICWLCEHLDRETKYCPIQERKKHPMNKKCDAFISITSHIPPRLATPEEIKFILSAIENGLELNYSHISIAYDKAIEFTVKKTSPEDTDNSFFKLL